MTARDTRPCPVCNGSGRTRTRTFDAGRFRPGAHPEQVTTERCETCNGTGSVPR